MTEPKPTEELGDWICGRCGEKHGTRIPIGATYHYGTCAWCQETKGVTAARKYGDPMRNSEKKGVDDGSS